ncbi:DedA family protein [Campylobacter sp. FMV-PI01]|uniref:DedA family protein n=1 Tax=Campylobacter portucalensis TaxID=2608384 RepID=A0A6L5WKG8_9BACT|nr:DedA family protein [Campylobacter portucalensis]MSN96737.1 DedA family protein [Campylobacter portucalensis]
MEEFLKELLFKYHDYAYIILFLWCILEGELALIVAGVMAHAGLINLPMSIFISGIGAFVGDQIYFYMGRYNKKYITKKLIKQKRKFAIAHLMLNQYGSMIIFIQRYMYGFRIIIPMSIGITRFNSTKYLFINLISAWCWAAITIILAWYFGDEIWEFVSLVEKHWYIAIPLILVFFGLIFYAFKKLENKFLNNRKEKYES